MNIIIKLLSNIVHYCHYRGFDHLLSFLNNRWYKNHLGYCGKNVYLGRPLHCFCPQKIFLYDNANINPFASFIINPKGSKGNFIMKKNSGAANGLTVITGNHQRDLGTFFKDNSSRHDLDIDKDIVVEEDVWIGANVTILSGVNVGRGSTIGAGSVCLKNVPPYAIVMGNPAKVVGFNYTPEEIVKHEKELYPKDEQLSIDLLQKNYEKYFINRITDIKQFNKL